MPRYTAFLRALIGLSLTAASAAQAAQCSPGAAPGKQLYWGDLHVHTALSLDAFAYGTTATPADAFAFARGAERTLADGVTRVKLRRPLDFVAVTDHAETFDAMYLCTDPDNLANDYCAGLRAGSGAQADGASSVFRDYLLPVIAGAEPKPPSLCSQDGIDCPAAAVRQWQRAQQWANEANEPCTFTAFIGNEWSATPNRQHWHRNLIFKGEAVTREAINYVNYPSPEKLWNALDDQCDPQAGCDVIAIPHNTNFSLGGGFDVETASAQERAQRAHYERLVEIYQSKGSSECLPTDWTDDNPDCRFETAFLHAGVEEQATTDPAYLKQLNRSHVRNILSRGLQAHIAAGEPGVNPLQLGLIGSTDNHTATPGFVNESDWTGDAWAGGGRDKERLQKRSDYSPGGLVAVWAEENTRDSVFDALKRRETYATSGPRIRLRFSADTRNNPDSCSPGYDTGMATTMGGTFTQPLPASPTFTVVGAQDEHALQRIEIIKGTVVDGEILETVHTVRDQADGFAHACEQWSDAQFDPAAPAYWYARVLETPSPRWSADLCRETGQCKPAAEQNPTIRERAWSSPIWYLP